MFRMDQWANPEYFWLLLIVPLLIVWYWFRQRSSNPELRFSGLNAFENIPHSPKSWLIHSLFVLRLLAIILLIIALARP